MKSLAILAALALAGCASFDPVRLAEAAEKLDPTCAKSVEINVTPLLIFGWPVPVVAGKYTKQCDKVAAP